MYDQAALQRATRLATSLREAERQVRILRSLAWPAGTRSAFLAANGTRLPAITYPAFDPTPALRGVDQVCAELHDGDPLDDWLGRTAEAIARGARMLAARGTTEFTVWSRQLYGEPRSLSADDSSTVLELARTVDAALTGAAHLDLGAPDPACHLATTVAAQLEAGCRPVFGDATPQIEVVDQLSSNALAGPSRIRLRRTACFTDRDVVSLLHHEAFVHVATALNGREQTALPLLSAGHAGTTRTQEGLAVFAEFLSGAMEPDRLRRLADRVLAIQMALDGADFLTVYRFFTERTTSAEQAFENTRRVFRGGVLEGGAPFTKDLVYLDGLLRVHSYLRAAIVLGRADCILLLFAGKLDLADIPLLASLAAAGILRPPRYLPPWIADRRFLVAYLAYSSFLDRVDLGTVRARVRSELDAAPALPPELGW